MYVTKETYKEWEKELFTIFARKRNYSTETIVPKNGFPTRIVRDKVILCVIPDKTKVYPEKIQLYHAGKGALDHVSIGPGNYPATDFGGLTNYKSIRPRFLLKTSFPVTSSAKEIVRLWTQWMGRPIHGPVLRNVSRWIRSVSQVLGSVRLNFARLPRTRRIALTKQDVRKATGVVYQRNFNGTDQEYANIDLTRSGYVTLDLQGKFVTPNINLQNLRNEYIVYT